LLQKAITFSLMNSEPLSVSKLRKREGQRLAQASKRLYDERALTNDEGHALSPGRRDTGQHQRVHEAALCRVPAMGDEVGLHATGRGFVPVGEGSHGDAATD
jgi:hypothetical protein